VAQARDGVIFIEALLRLGGGLDVPFDEIEAKGRGHLLGKLGLAGAGFALDQQRPLQRDRRIYGHHQILFGDIGRSAFETHSKLRFHAGGDTRSRRPSRQGAVRKLAALQYIEWDRTLGQRTHAMTARKTAIVTGSTSGIGLAIAHALAAEGCNIVVNSFSNTESDHAVAKGIAGGHEVEAIY